MEAIFGHAMATGKHALGSGEALGQNQADSVAAKVEGVASSILLMPLMSQAVARPLRR